MHPLSTDRLYFRYLTPEDAPSFYQLNKDPEVLRYTGDRPFTTLEEARAFLEKYDQYERYGYGRWGVVRQSDGHWLGWCGLKYSPGLQETDIGFRFLRQYWGRGYATEAARACLEHGFATLRLNTVVGRAMIQNGASVRVLEKIGMRYWKDFDFDGQPGVYYQAFPGTYSA